MEALLREFKKKVLESEEVLISSRTVAVSRSQINICERMRMKMMRSVTLFWESVNSLFGTKYAVSTLAVCLNSFLGSLVYLSQR